MAVKDAAVLLIIDGKPLLVGKTVGKGRVLMWTGCALSADKVKNTTAENKTLAIPEPLLKATLEWVSAK